MNSGVWLIVVGLMAGLGGCDNVQGTAQLQEYLQAVQARPGVVIEPVAQVEPRAVFVYDAMALRSPFQAQREEDEGSWQTSLVDDVQGERVRQLLEGVDLARIEMVGTLSNEQQTNALLRANGIVHRLQVGDYLGRNNGQIAQIGAAHIEVFEVISDGRGGWLERSLTIPLKQQS